MDVVSTSVLPVAGVHWVSPSGAPMLTVVCRATFALQPVVSRLADQQDPIVRADVHWGQDPQRSLLAASDLVPHKARPEVLLVGHAYAPKGQPVRTVLARLVVGSIDKSVEVMADRWLTRDGEVREGAPWTKRALWYEGAAVGSAGGNPAGMSFDGEDLSGARRLPYLQPRGARPDMFETACFAPLAPGWPLRDALGSRLGARWAQAVAADRPLPDDVDPAFFNCAPPDQQLQAIRPDERVLLEHLHPKHARLLTSLPGIAPRAEIARLGKPPAPLALVPDTLWIDTDRAVCALVFRGAVPLAYRSEPGCVTVHLDLPDAAGDAGEARTIAAPLDSLLAAPAPFPIAESGAPRAPASSSALPFHALGALPLGAVPLGAPPVVAPPPPVVTPPPPVLAPPPPVLVGPADATPWAAQPVIAAPLVGSIGQRLALEQAIAEADAARDARPPPEVPHLGPLAVQAPDPPSPAAPAPLAGANEAADIAGGPTEDEPAPAGQPVVLIVYSESGLVDRLKREERRREELDAIEAEAGDEPLARIDEEDPGLLVSWIARAEPSSPAALRAALRAAARADGRLDCPLAVVEGTLAASFDARERLRTLSSAALAIAPDDEDLLRAAAAARSALEGGVLPLAVAARLEAAVRDAFRAKERALSPRDLTIAVERALIEQRAFARRDVLDGPHVRAELACGDAPPLVVYLPEAAARALPLARKIRARLLVEVRPREDDQEACPIALRARAVARLHHIPID